MSDEDAVSVDQVVSEILTATKDQILQLPLIRKAKAKDNPYVLPGTDPPLTVLVAPVDQIGKHAIGMRALAERIKAKGGDMDLAAVVEDSNVLMVKHCVVEPALDDETIAALRAYNAEAWDGLLEK